MLNVQDARRQRCVLPGRAEWQSFTAECLRWFLAADRPTPVRLLGLDEQPGHKHHGQPEEDAGAGECGEGLPLAVLQQGKQFDGHLGYGSGADAQQERGEGRLVDGGSDERPGDGGRPGDEPKELPAGASRGGSLASGVTMARPSVVLWMAKPTISEAPRAREPTA